MWSLYWGCRKSIPWSKPYLALSPKPRSPWFLVGNEGMWALCIPFKGLHNEGIHSLIPYKKTVSPSTLLSRDYLTWKGRRALCFLDETCLEQPEAHALDIARRPQLQRLRQGLPRVSSPPPPQTPNPKPQTPNPKPQTPNPKP